MDHLSSLDHNWRHPQDNPPPRATKLILYLTTGITVIGDWRDEDSLLWMPLPKIPKELKSRLEKERKKV